MVFPIPGKILLLLNLLGFLQELGAEEGLGGFFLKIGITEELFETQASRSQ